VVGESFFFAFFSSFFPCCPLLLEVLLRYLLFFPLFLLKSITGRGPSPFTPAYLLFGTCSFVCRLPRNLNKISLFLRLFFFFEPFSRFYSVDPNTVMRILTAPSQVSAPVPVLEETLCSPSSNGLLANVFSFPSVLESFFYQPRFVPFSSHQALRVSALTLPFRVFNSA